MRGTHWKISTKKRLSGKNVSSEFLSRLFFSVDHKQKSLCGIVVCSCYSNLHISQLVDENIHGPPCLGCQKKFRSVSGTQMKTSGKFHFDKTFSKFLELL